MRSMDRGRWISSFILCATLGLASLGASAHEVQPEMRWVQFNASTKEARSALANVGVSLEAFYSDSVWGFATPRMIKDAQKLGIKVLGSFEQSVSRGGHDDFPAKDARFHNYTEMVAALRQLNSMNADITRLHVIGKSLEGRDIYALHINMHDADLVAGKSSLPGAIFMGNHHAREHVSAEIPLMLAEHLLKNRADAKVAKLLEERDIWIIPMVNPDGVEFDIATGQYKMWRKNRSKNKDGTSGVDLNRNYGFKWGTGGSSTDPSSDVYMGPQPFSEPESRAIRDFVEAHLNARVLLTFHTFSELILYPWGHKNDPITDQRDLGVYEKMAKTMAAWNGYKPMQASGLYIASGDTTDWAYGEHKIFSFTFELSPRDQWSGGFYPGAGVIDRVFQANLQPCLYMIEVAADPYAVTEDSDGRSRFLPNLVLK